MESEKNPSTPGHPEKNASFSRNESNKKNQASVPESPSLKDADDDPQTDPETKEITDPEEEKPADEPKLTHPQILHAVDQFLRNESVIDDIPKPVELLTESIESMIDKYRSEASKLGQNPEEDSSFLDSVAYLSRVIEKMRGMIWNGDSNPSPNAAAVVACLDRTSTVLQRAMAFLEDGLRSILDRSISKSTIDETLQQKSLKSPRHSSSFSSNCSNQESDRCALPGGQPETEEEFPGFTAENISCMNKIVNSMISAGYETECCMVYSILRRFAFRDALKKLGYEVVSIEEVQKIQWESLEGEIALWNNVVKQTSSTLLPGERKICSSVFADHQDVSRALFMDLAKSVCLQLLNFAEAMVLTKRSAEQLFKFLDIYEALRDLIGSLNYDGESSRYWEELKAEVLAVKRRISEAAASRFCDLENSIKSDNGKIPVPSGAVHPLTRYTMNYLRYACDEYKDTLEKVFQQHDHHSEELSRGEAVQEQNHDHENENSSNNNNNNNNNNNAHGTRQGGDSSPFAAQFVSVMELLDTNLDMKSKLYKDPSLRYIFLMNNGRYIVQKIKGSTEIHQMMGDTWCRKRSSDLRQYHKNYQRETWYKLLQCLNPEGLHVNGKVVKTVLKEKFKTFNAMFDEIHKAQSTWVVSDEQLQSELRVSISAVVTPAYRSFLGRYNQYLDPGRQSEKYIKYQPEDIENLIDELFDGNPTSMGRRRA